MMQIRNCVALVLLMCVAILVPANDEPRSLNRDEIEERFKWDLGPLYPNVGAWTKALESAGAGIEAFAVYKGTLSSDPEQLAKGLEARSRIQADAEQVFVYAYFNHVEDTRNQKNLAHLEEAKVLLGDLESATAWVRPEIMEIPAETLTGWIDSSDSLASFRFPLEEMLRTRAHTLDEAGENLLALFEPLNSGVSGIYGAATVTDAEFPTVTLSDGTTMTASSSGRWTSLHDLRDQKDRKTVNQGFIAEFDRRENTLAALYGAILQRNRALARARGYNSSLEHVLDVHNIPVAVYQGLIKTARTGAEPLHRYHRLRKEALGLDEFYFFDRRIPLVESEVSYDYDSTRKILIASVEPLGEGYQREVERYFVERRIDVYENEGKQPRNFAVGSYRGPGYIKLNYGENLEDALTFAHEMGHAIHADYARNNQPQSTFDYATFIAETASTFCEDLFQDELLEGTMDPRIRIALLQSRIDAIAMGFYEIALLADFELRAHTLAEEGQPITAEVLQGLYLGLFKEYYGDTVDDQELLKNEWTTWVHFFFDRPFYVFQYATSLAASTVLFRQVTTGTDAERSKAVERYLDLIGAGGSDHPIELLKTAGVDLTDPKALQGLADEMDRLVTELEIQLKKLGTIQSGVDEE